MAEPAEVVFGQLLIGGIAFMVMAGGSLLAFLITYQKRLLQQKLDIQHVEAEHQQRLLEAVIEAQENERARIGQELHDGLGATVASAKLLAGRLRRVPEGAFVGEQTVLLEELLRTAAEDVRSISHNLYPAVLVRYGLAEALRHLVEVYNQAGMVPVLFHAEYEPMLSPVQELALYRVCQELVHNAFTHGHGATEVRVALVQEPGSLLLAVSDDGCGYTADVATGAPAPRRGIGLRSVEARVRLLGGQLTCHTAVGQGTRTELRLQAPKLAEATIR